MFSTAHHAPWGRIANCRYHQCHKLALGRFRLVMPPIFLINNFRQITQSPCSYKRRIPHSSQLPSFIARHPQIHAPFPTITRCSTTKHLGPHPRPMPCERSSGTWSHPIPCTIYRMSFRKSCPFQHFHWICWNFPVVKILICVTFTYSLIAVLLNCAPPQILFATTRHVTWPMNGTEKQNIVTTSIY